MFSARKALTVVAWVLVIWGIPGLIDDARTWIEWFPFLQKWIHVLAAFLGGATTVALHSKKFPYAATTISSATKAQTEKEPNKSATHKLTTAVRPRVDRRVWCELSPKEICALMKGRTGMQQDRVIKRFRGNWLRISGTVYNVEDRGGSDGICVWVERSDEAPAIFVTVYQRKYDEYLATLRKGDAFVAEAKIYSASDDTLHLEDGIPFAVDSFPRTAN